MKLYSSTTSPFGRLCIIVGYLSKKDLALQFVMPWENPAELLAVNPYSQIPALVCDNGQVLTETLIIADYLNKDILAAGDPKISFAITTLSQVVKTFTLQLHAAAGQAPHPHVQRANEAIARALRLAPELDPASDCWGDIFLAVALGYASLRVPAIFEECASASNRAALLKYLEKEFMVKTTPEALGRKPAHVRDL